MQGYNPSTGNYAAAGYRSSPYGTASAGRTYNPYTGASGAAAGVKTSQGAAAVGETQSGNVYAAKDGTVYQKNANGSWSQNTGSGWQSVSKPQPTDSIAAAHPTSFTPYSSSANWNPNRQSIESQAQARSWGNQQHQYTQSWRSGGYGSYGGRRR